MVQVFKNLISNSIKYCNNYPKIHISATKKGNEWVFSFKDNGIGINPQYKDKIFVIFQRLHAERDYSGTGIGLALCKKIIENHGGRIWFDSGASQGTTFFVALAENAPGK